jgi:hypothetical protein
VWLWRVSLRQTNTPPSRQSSAVRVQFLISTASGTVRMLVWRDPSLKTVEYVPLAVARTTKSPFRTRMSGASLRTTLSGSASTASSAYKAISP